MKKLMMALCVAMLFAPGLVPAVAAPNQAPSTMPPYGKDKPIPIPQITKQTLPNGLQVWVVPRKGLPRVDYVLALRGAGYAADDKAHPGFASILAGMLNEGTAKRNSRAVAETAQSLGGTVGGGASHDGITVFANALASNAGPMMALMAEVARQPAFPDREVELAKVNALEALKVSEATPGFRAERALNKAVHGDHPYGQSAPTAQAINAIDQALLRREHGRRFRPDRALLVVTGRITSAQALKLAASAFGNWKASGTALAETARAPTTAKPVRLVLERPGSVQSTVRLGSPGIAATMDDYVPLRLASTVLGGGFTSRINLNLREEKGYTYGASAGARSFRQGGAIVGGADVRNEVTGASLKEYFSEYGKLATELVPPEELAMNKRYVAGTYTLSNQLQGAVAATLANNWLVGLPPEFLGRYVPAIQKVTAEQVRDVARKYFAPENQSIVVVGDSAAIAEQLKAYGQFTVQEK